jgi:uncharacterized membrane protein
MNIIGGHDGKMVRVYFCECKQAVVSVFVCIGMLILLTPATRGRTSTSTTLPLFGVILPCPIICGSSQNMVVRSM